MNTERPLNPDISGDQFLAMLAKEVIRQAVSNEGLANWSLFHGGDPENPAKTAREYAFALYGNSDEAVVFNDLLANELKLRS